MQKRRNIAEDKVSLYFSLITHQNEAKETRRWLIARGFTPDHPSDLLEQARIFDNRALVKSYIANCDKLDKLAAISQPGDPRYAKQFEKLERSRKGLKQAGIFQYDPRRLERILRDIDARARHIEKRRNPRYACSKTSKKVERPVPASKFNAPAAPVPATTVDKIEREKEICFLLREAELYGLTDQAEIDAFVTANLDHSADA